VNPFETVVAIVVLGVIGAVITTFIKTIGERRERNNDSAGDAEELRDLER
jgi:hypothetical protein